MPFTLKDIELLQQKCKIRGYTITPVKCKAPVAKKSSKEKQWLEQSLQTWCDEKGLTLDSEYRFTKDRKWRFDHSIPSMRTAIEFEGINSFKSRHTTLTGYTGDTEKYNRAASEGWTVLRYTVLNYKTVINDLNSIYDKI